MKEGSLHIWDGSEQTFFCGRKGDTPGEKYLTVENGKLVHSHTGDTFDKTSIYNQLLICSRCMGLYKKKLE